MRCSILAWCDDEDDQNDEYDTRFSPWVSQSDAQNLHHIKQRKKLCFIHALSDDEDDKDDGYDSGIIFDRDV